MLGSNLRLDAAPRVSITRDNNGALDRNTQTLQLLVVIGNAVVDINQRRSDVTITGIGVVGRELFGLLVRGGVGGGGRLRWFGSEFGALYQLQGTRFRRGAQDVNALHA